MPTDHDAPPAFTLVLTPERPALIIGRPTTVNVLVRVQAPPAPVDAPLRRPLHLALVLDRSGSMCGQPLDAAKRCARHIVDGLAPDDRAAIFAFDDEVTCVAPLTRGDGKLALATALEDLRSGGSTDLHAGWRAGAEALAGSLASSEIHRVILLSDGAANHGETDPEAIAAQCKALAQRGVTTSTYGLGRDFNESLMLAMASAGHGNAYYGETAADLAEPFAAEFALLGSLCARGLVVKVNAPNDIPVTIRNGYPAVEGERNAWRLPDLAYASEAWALVELTVDLKDSYPDEALLVPITVSVAAATSDSAALFLMASLQPLTAVGPATFESLAADSIVARRLLELDAADALAVVREAVEAQDWSRVARLVDVAKARFAGHEWAAAVLATIERLAGERDRRRAAKESAFASRSMRARLSTPNEPSFSAADEPAIPSFLRRKGEQGKGRREF